MRAFETFTTVQAPGDIRVAGVPFAPGTEVEVSIAPRRLTAAEFVAVWDRVCGSMRSLPQVQSITDEEIQKEVDDYRAGR